MWISLMGIFNHDSTIFDKFNLPKKVDKNVLINQLLLQSAEREILYADPNLLKDYIGYWSAARVDVWEHLFATTKYDYNPIENYDRNEVWSDTEKMLIKIVNRLGIIILDMGRIRGLLKQTVKKMTIKQRLILRTYGRQDNGGLLITSAPILASHAMGIAVVPLTLQATAQKTLHIVVAYTVTSEQ